MLAALSGSAAQLRSADSRADKAAKAAKAAKGDNAKLKKALELARKQEAKAATTTDAKKHEAPPAPPEPVLHDVPVKDDKPKAEVLEDLGQQKPTKRSAAERLYAYVLREIREGRSANLGSKGNPNPEVLAGQKGMTKVTADGIYGPKTRERGKELTGKPWPARGEVTRPKAATPAPAPPKPRNELPPPPPVVREEPKPKAKAKAERPAPVPAARRSAVQAAEDLLAHAKAAIASGKAASQLGSKSAPNQTVALAQADMGELTADGIYGPATRARGKALTGKTFPARA
jgi:hypothetical protein